MTWIFVTAQHHNFVTPRESMPTRHALVIYFNRDSWFTLTDELVAFANIYNDDDDDDDIVVIEITACGKVTRRPNGTRLAT